MTIRGDLLFGLEERHVAGNPKQNDGKAVFRLFLWGGIGKIIVCKYKGNTCVSKKNHNKVA